VEVLVTLWDRQSAFTKKPATGTLEPERPEFQGCPIDRYSQPLAQLHLGHRHVPRLDQRRTAGHHGLQFRELLGSIQQFGG
jgi:hypothetical protein